MSGWNIAAIAIAVLVVWIWLDTKWHDYRYRNPTIHTNHTIPAKQAMAVHEAMLEGRGAVFHGGCLGCIFRAQNTTHTGLAFCRGCSYFMFDQTLPDRSITDYKLGK